MRKIRRVPKKKNARAPMIADPSNGVRSPLKLASAQVAPLFGSTLWTKNNHPHRTKPRGPHKRTREVQALAERLVTSKAYLRNLEKRLVKGKAPHMEITLFHYAFGKPRDVLKIEDDRRDQQSRASQEFKVLLSQMAGRVLATLRQRAQAESALAVLPPLPGSEHDGTNGTVAPG